jgi:hypothetical protein
MPAAKKYEKALAFLGLDLLQRGAEFGYNLHVILVQPLRAGHLRTKSIFKRRKIRWIKGDGLLEGQ